MDKKLTIKEAAIEVLKKEKKPLTAKEIYDIIIKEGLYNFKAKEPVGLLKSEIRSCCDGINNKTSKPQKFFKQVGEKFELI